MRSTNSLLFLLLALLLISFSTSLGIPGGWSPIADVSNPRIQSIARFAVAEQNKRSRQELVYVKVVSGESQVVAGTNYKLVLLARPVFRRYLAMYEAVVYDRPWDNHRELLSFKLQR